MKTEVIVLMRKASFLDKIKFVNRDLLKWIALFFMGIGHFLLFTAAEFKYFGLQGSVLKFFIMMQYIAPPIFFFFISEGYHYTHSKKQYFIRLLVNKLSGNPAAKDDRYDVFGADRYVGIECVQRYHRGL